MSSTPHNRRSPPFQLLPLPLSDLRILEPRCQHQVSSLQQLFLPSSIPALPARHHAGKRQGLLTGAAKRHRSEILLLASTSSARRHPLDHSGDRPDESSIQGVLRGRNVGRGPGSQRADLRNVQGRGTGYRYFEVWWGGQRRDGRGAQTCKSHVGCLLFLFITHIAVQFMTETNFI